MRRSVLTQAWLRLTLSLAALTLLQTAHAQTRELATRGELLDRVAAIVNDGVVLQSELDDQVAIVGERIKQQKLDLPPQNVLRQQVLERLVLQEIQMQRANKAGLKVSDDNLNAALQDVAQRNKLTLAQLPEALAGQGIDYAAYRDDIRKELTLSLLRQRDVLQRIAITPREVDQYIDKQAKTPSDKSEYNISHILIAVPQEASPTLVEQAANKAQELFHKAKGG
jgi:peptidyl-prolyl cis-trans isomerase SurA